MSKPKPTRHAPAEVDAYIAAQEPEFRGTLEQLREAIKRAAPQCTERVSYKIPIFRLRKDFVAISAAKKHIGFHTMSKAIPAAMKAELKAVGIWTSGSTFHIKPGVDLPMEQIEKALNARLAELTD